MSEQPTDGRGMSGEGSGEGGLSSRKRPRAAAADAEIAIDPCRAVLFPNRVREQRRRRGLESLLMLAERLPAIPYIRLSKIERGEVFARAPELRMIAAAIGLDDPSALLVDVEAPGFSTPLWAGSRGKAGELNREAEELAMLLAAALRMRRAEDPALTLARLQGEYGLPAVMVSRIENAVKPFDRWNAETIASVCRLIGVDGRAALAARLRALHDAGALAGWLRRVPGAAEREGRMRERIAALRAELERLPPVPAMDLPGDESNIRPAGPPGGQGRLLTVLGIPTGDGLIEPFASPQRVAPPPGAGPDAYALRMCRASLGPAIPGHAVLIVDPGRTPVQGGLAVLREEGGLRVLAVTTDRDGRLYGVSGNPEKDIPLDAVPPADLAMVTAVLFG